MDVSFALDYSRVPPGAPRRVHLLVRIETSPGEGGPERKPLNLAVALDRSGSMEGPKLRAAKDAVGRLLDRLSPRDVFSLVAFDDGIEVVLPPGPVEDPHGLRRRVDALSVRGQTNLSGGWLKALSLARERLAEDRLHRVLLLTDGQANAGVTAREDLVRLAGDHRVDGIVTTTLGFGQDFNEGDLSAIAEAAGGRFHYIDAPEKAPTAFLSEFGDLARVFGQNLEVRIVPGDGIPVPTLLGLPGKLEPDGARRVALGDVREGELKTVLASFVLPADLPPGRRELATIDVRYDAVRGKSGTRRHVLEAEVTVDPSVDPQAPPAPEVLLAVLTHEVARFKESALERLDRGDSAGARRDLESALDVVLKHRGASPRALDREAGALQRLMSEARVSARKDLTSQSFQSRTQSGDYRSAPAGDARSFAFGPGRAGELEDAAEALETMLRAAGFGEEARARLEAALRELVENALEHGGKGQAAPQVEVDLEAGRNHARVVVRDNGPGFDFKGALERRETKGPRGRGLLLVRKAVDALTANAAGNEIMAEIRRESFNVAAHSDAFITSQGVGTLCVVKVKGSIDSKSVIAFQTHVNSLKERGVSAFVFDLSDVTYINSTGLGYLINVADSVTLERVGVALVGVRPKVKVVFDMLGLNQFFGIYATVEEAKRALAVG